MGPTGFPTKMLNGMATTERRQKTMCSCIECVGDHPEPTPEEIAAYEAREKTAGRAVEASPSRFLIIGSNTLGPESLTSEGFDWVFAPLDVAKLGQQLVKCKKMEDAWDRRIHRWQNEGAMGDSPVSITPGVIAWLVEIDSGSFGECPVEARLGDVATKLAKHLPHVTLAFDNDCFDADALASRMIQLLQQITPIWFQTDDAAASTPNQHTKELL